MVSTWQRKRTVRIGSHGDSFLIVNGVESMSRGRSTSSAVMEMLGSEAAMPITVTSGPTIFNDRNEGCRRTNPCTRDSADWLDATRAWVALLVLPRFCSCLFLGSGDMKGYDRLRFPGLGFGNSDFGTATSRRVSSVMRSNTFGSGVSSGSLGLSFICRLREERSATSPVRTVLQTTLARTDKPTSASRPAPESAADWQLCGHIGTEHRRTRTLRRSTNRLTG